MYTYYYDSGMPLNMCTIDFLHLKLKDAKSVSLYPYNRSQILQYVKYTKKLTLNKELQNFETNNVF